MTDDFKVEVHNSINDPDSSDDFWGRCGELEDLKESLAKKHSLATVVSETVKKYIDTDDEAKLYYSYFNDDTALLTEKELFTFLFKYPQIIKEYKRRRYENK
jgi:hypothetical protein